ncbi:hypothetical protein [Pararhizobium antarcticum]|nr:hypothetical protein [Pararhizobium antarcticum]
MKIRTMPLGFIFIGLLIATICSIALVPHRASSPATASISGHART